MGEQYGAGLQSHCRPRWTIPLGVLSIREAFRMEQFSQHRLWGPGSGGLSIQMANTKARGRKSYCFLLGRGLPALGINRPQSGCYWPHRYCCLAVTEPHSSLSGHWFGFFLFSFHEACTTNWLLQSSLRSCVLHKCQTGGTEFVTRCNECPIQ